LFSQPAAAGGEIWTREENGMPIITIRGQLGSGAPEIGRLVASHLGIDYVDREIVAETAAKLNYPEEKIEKQEMPPGTLFMRIKDAINRSYPPAPDTAGFHPAMMYLPPADIPLDDAGYLSGLESVIQTLAETNSIVIRGRGSQFILKNHPGAIHILTVASLETRIKRIMNSMNLDEKSARQEISNFDNSRHEFIKRYFKANLDDPLNYDLVVNTEHLGYEASASIIINSLHSPK
jgi:cytidylate kinase